MKKVIINADDFGYSTAVNGGIIKAYQEGVLSSTTLMANMPGSKEAIDLAHENDGLGIGGHLVLTCGSPMTACGTLIDSKGKFFNLENYQKNRHKMADEEIFNEWCQQIDYLLGKKISLTHLDSHHHIHTFSENLTITKRIAEKYGLTFRNNFNLEEKVQLPNQKGITGFYDWMNFPNIRDLKMSYYDNKEACFREVKEVLGKLQKGEISELMVHPAFVDGTLYFNSSFSVARIKEVEILCDPDLRQYLEEDNIHIINYAEAVNE